jgi:nitroreductase
MVEPTLGAFPVALAEMPFVEWAAAVVTRHSARSFTGAMVDPGALDRLERFATSLPGSQTARVVIVRELPERLFTGVVGSYGKVVGARSGLLVIGQENDLLCQEAAGYLGEAAILQAGAEGLDSCWVGGFFDRPLSQTLVDLAPGERVLAVSPLGQAQARPRAGERMLKRIVGAHKRRPVEEIAPGFDEESWPAWAAEGVRLARAAPSAVHRQPWPFRVDDDPARTSAHAGPTGAMTVSVVERGHSGSVSRRLDGGIAMLHFEVGARLMGAVGRWETLPAPDLARYRVTSWGALKNSTPNAPTTPNAARTTYPAV